MPSYDQTPGTLNLAFNRGDDFSALVDFSIGMTAYTVTAAVTSLVTGSEVVTMTTSFQDSAAGQVNISLSDTQTSALASGTYGWNLKWVEGSATRTALTGMVEVS